MKEGTGLADFSEKYPDKHFDVGIAEEHAVTFSGGLAAEGYRPIVSIYSTFLQRAYDQIIHDVALQNLPVIFAIDRGGLVGADGATHHGVFDLAYLNAIPNMIISSPMDELEFRNLLFTARIKNHGPFAIRYPRGKGTGIEWNLGPESIEIGTGRKLKEGKDIAFVSIGHIGNQIEKAAAQLEELNIDYAHYDIRFLKPFDKQLLHEVFQNHDKIITIEDGTIIGGLGSTVRDFMNEHNYQATIVKMGIPDQFIGHGTPEQLYKAIGLDAEGIVHTAQKLIQNKKFFQRKASS